jgi:coniferyl-aldehyde dehydrogenase
MNTSVLRQAAAPADPTGVGADAAEIARMQRLLASQRDAFAAHPFPTVDERRAKLRALRDAIRDHQDAIASAISADFGGRSVFESKFADVIGPILEIDHALSHLRRWMRPQRRRTELVFATNTASVAYQPKGVVGIVTPWNFPVYLALGPLVAALAAGNRALVKMSEYTPRTTEALRAVLADAFSEDEVAVIGGAVDAARAFTRLPFDHLVFTGSPAVAPHVMRAAAENLVPVTLELGGKSPAIVAPGADLVDAAARIAHGKAFNAGQICVSPDYALVPRAQVDAFADAAIAAFRRLYPATSGNAQYTAIVNDAQHARLLAILDDARAHGATIRVAADTGTPASPRRSDERASNAPPPDRRMPLHVVTGVTPEMRVAREELFGPILPVIGYESVDDAIRHVAARPRPLAMYPFGFGGTELQRLLRLTHAGGVTVNDWGWHVFNHDLPFGGIGTSGMGTYHGEEGFRTLSHAKAVLKKHRFFPVALFYPPYGNFVQRLVMRYYLGPPRK